MLENVSSLKLRFLPLGYRIVLTHAWVLLLADVGCFCAQVDSREESEQSLD